MTYSVIVEDKNGRTSRIANGQGFFKAIKGAKDASIYGNKAHVVSDAKWFAYRDGMVRSFV